MDKSYWLHDQQALIGRRIVVLYREFYPAGSTVKGKVLTADQDKMGIMPPDATSDTDDQVTWKPSDPFPEGLIRAWLELHHHSTGAIQAAMPKIKDSMARMAK